MLHGLQSRVLCQAGTAHLHDDNLLMVCMTCRVKVLAGYRVVHTRCTQGCATWSLSSCKRAAKCACRAHGTSKERSVREVLCAVQAVAAELGCAVHIAQQWPLRWRDEQGQFQKRPCHVDIVVCHHASALGIEVHGSIEHVIDAKVVARDHRKKQAWEGMHDELLTVFGPGLLDAEQSRADWLRAMHTQVRKRMQGLLCT